MDRLTERLDVALRALSTFDELAGKASPSKIERDAAIQRFEYTFEATWKAAQLYLREAAGIEVASPKAVARSCWQVGILTDEDGHAALDMVDDRIMTVHTYNERVAASIYEKSGAHAALLRRWLLAMVGGGGAQS